MAESTIETLYIEFKQKGIDSVLTKVNALNKSLTSFSYVLEQINGIQSSLSGTLEEQSKIVRGLGEKLKSLPNSKTITINVKERKTVEGEGGEGGFSSFGKSAKASFELLKGITKLALAAPLMYSAGKSLSKVAFEERKNIQLFSNALKQSGLDNKTARNRAFQATAYGSTMEEVLSTFNSISTSLGAMSRGDTSLVEALGKYGIGGISPMSTPSDVIDKITERVGRGDLGKNEINHLLSMMPFDSGQKQQIMEGFPELYKVELDAFNADKENQKKMLQQQEALQSVLVGTSEYLAESGTILSGVETAYWAFANEFPKLSAEFNLYEGLLKDMNALLTSIASMVGAILGSSGGATYKAISSVLGATLGKVAPTVISAIDTLVGRVVSGGGGALAGGIASVITGGMMVGRYNSVKNGSPSLMFAGTANKLGNNKLNFGYNEPSQIGGDGVSIPDDEYNKKLYERLKRRREREEIDYNEYKTSVEQSRYIRSYMESQGIDMSDPLKKNNNQASITNNFFNVDASTAGEYGLIAMLGGDPLDNAMVYGA